MISLIWVNISEEDSENSYDSTVEVIFSEGLDPILYWWAYKYILNICIIQYTYK